MMYEVVISIPMKIKLEGEFDSVTKEAMEIGDGAHAALVKAVKDADYVEILKPKIISAINK